MAYVDDPQWIQDVRPASFNGIEFYVESSAVTFSRNNVVHTFPFSDNSWIEDLGMLPTVFSFRAFIGGNDSDPWEWQAALQAQAYVTGAGDLIHPTQGSVRAHLQTMTCLQGVDNGNKIEVELTFLSVPQGSSGILADTTGLLDSLGKEFLDISESSFVTSIRDGLEAGRKTSASIRASVGEAVRMGTSALNDATSAYNAVRGVGKFLGINMGRYDGGLLSKGYSVLGKITGGLTTAKRAETGIRSMLSAATTARSTVTAAGNKLSGLLGRL